MRLPCARCGKPGALALALTDSPAGSLDSRVVLCDPCNVEWTDAPERRRAISIVRSLLAEWSERLRCEALAHAAPNVEPTEGEKPS